MNVYQQDDACMLHWLALWASGYSKRYCASWCFWANYCLHINKLTGPHPTQTCCSIDIPLYSTFLTAPISGLHFGFTSFVPYIHTHTHTHTHTHSPPLSLSLTHTHTYIDIHIWDRCVQSKIPLTETKLQLIIKQRPFLDNLIYFFNVGSLIHFF